MWEGEELAQSQLPFEALGTPIIHGQGCIREPGAPAARASQLAFAQRILCPGHSALISTSPHTTRFTHVSICSS